MLISGLGTTSMSVYIVTLRKVEYSLTEYNFQFPFFPPLNISTLS